MDNLNFMRWTDRFGQPGLRRWYTIILVVCDIIHISTGMLSPCSLKHQDMMGFRLRKLRLIVQHLITCTVLFQGSSFSFYINWIATHHMSDHFTLNCFS